MKHMLMLAVLALMSPAGSQDPGAVRTVPSVNLDRYAGEWHEAARLPNRFQDKCAGDVRATYARRADGRIDVVNRCRERDGSIAEARGIARVVDTSTNAQLKVRFAPAFLSFLPMVWGDYWILGLAPDYSWAVVGSPGRKYLWVLSRTAVMDQAQFDAAVAVARAQGFQTGGLIRAR